MIKTTMKCYLVLLLAFLSTIVQAATTCPPNLAQDNACTIAHGTGTQTRTCNALGTAWGKYDACSPLSCNGGYVSVADKCEKLVCTANLVEKATCTIAHGVGSKSRTCNATGTNVGIYGDCGVVSCDNGYLISGNKCIQSECSPNLSQADACMIGNGVGSRTRLCNALGTAWGNYSACLLLSCNRGFANTAGKCIQSGCTPNLAQDNACPMTNGTGTQRRTCNALGTAWGNYNACSPLSCNGGYASVAGKCEKLACAANLVEKATCTIAHGVGSKSRTCNATGTNAGIYGDCGVVSCDNGYLHSGNKCIQSECSPNSSQADACPISSGTGTRTRLCNALGTAWGNYGACSPLSCHSGFASAGGKCIKVINAATSAALAASGNTPTNAAYTALAASVALTCPPNSSQSDACTISNGTGTRTRFCNALGTAWGSYNACSPLSCNGGYVSAAGKCEKLVCTANLVEKITCTIAHGAGSKSRTCNATGTNVGIYLYFS